MIFQNCFSCALQRIVCLPSCSFIFFLLTCYVTLQPAMSVHLSVCPLVGWFVGHLFGQRPQRGRWPMLSHRGIFSSSFSFSVPPPLQAHILALRPKSQSWGPNPNLKAQIPSYSQNPIFEAQIPASRDLGLKTGIWASRLGYGLRGWDMGLEVGGRERRRRRRRRRKFPCVKA